MGVEAGPGPIGGIFERLVNGEIGLDEACRLAGEPECSHALNTSNCEWLSDYAHGFAQRGVWQKAVILHKLLQAGLAAGAPVSAQAKTRCFAQWVEIVSTALNKVQDPRLYFDALHVAERELASLKKSGDKKLLADFYHALGILHLDPYVVNRSPKPYEASVNLWARQGPAWDGEMFPESSEGSMPAPAKALTLAAEYLQSAAQLHSDTSHSASLKALVQALTWFPVVGLPSQEKRVAEVAQEAVEALGTTEPHKLLEVLYYARKAGAKPDLAALEPILRVSLEEHSRRIGNEAAMFMVVFAAALLADTDPQRSLDLLTRSSALFERYAGDDMKVRWWETQMSVLGRARSRVKGGAPSSVEKASRKLLTKAERERWDVADIAGSLFLLSQYTTNSNEESIGLKLLDEAERLSPLTLAPYRQMLTWFRAHLQLNAGVNAFRGNDWTQALDRYCSSLRLALEVGALSLATDIIDRIADVARQADAQGAIAIINGLQDVADDAEQKLGEPATQRLSIIYSIAQQALAAGRVNLAVLQSLWSLAKGRQFSRLLAAGAANEYQHDERAQELIGSVTALLDKIDQPGLFHRVVPNAEAYEEYLTLQPYSATALALEGKSEAERLARLELEFQKHTNRRLLASAGQFRTPLISASDIQAALDADTVLIEYFISQDNGSEALYQLAWTRDEFQIGASKVSNPMNNTSVEVDGLQLQFSAVQGQVAGLREALRAEPNGEAASTKAAERLIYLQDVLLGPVYPWLQKQREKGKTHLCIVPHGPLHFMPFHLLGDVAHPLAEVWRITCLPNLGLLLAQRGRVAVQRHRPRMLSAFGIGFTEDPRGLEPPIPQAVDEAQAVARNVEGGIYIPESKATKSEVLEAMRESRFVHIATHGEQNAVAPLFQRLYLAAGTHGEDELFAHELLTEDLRGLEMVTLSACETALGRFDMGDNLQGLAAVLFLSGVRSIVGTLWDVETRAAESFFTTLYSGLARGASQIEAFHAAQAETRRKHPEHRDWGAFYYVGTWKD